MGAGTFPAGRGRAGYDPSYIPPAPRVITTPRAIFYDPSLKSYVMSSDGQFLDIHPVDQQVIILLFAEQNGTPSAPTLGMRFRQRIARVDQSKIAAIALDEVQTVLRDLIANGDVLLVSADVDLSVPRAVVIKPTYVNLRDPALDPRNPLATAVRTPPI